MIPDGVNDELGHVERSLQLEHPGYADIQFLTDLMTSLAWLEAKAEQLTLNDFVNSTGWSADQRRHARRRREFSVEPVKHADAACLTSMYPFWSW